MKTKLDKEEQQILDAIEKGEWEAVKPAKAELSRYAQIAKATLKKDQRMNIQISKVVIAKGHLPLTRGETVSWADVKKKADRQKNELSF